MIVLGILADQAVHRAEPPVSRPLAGDRAGGCGDRGDRDARSAHVPPRRRGALLDRRVRRSLFTPGSGVRPPGGALFDPGEGRTGVGPAHRADVSPHHARLARHVRGASTAFGTLFWIGYACAVALLAWQHSIVSAEDISRINAAFFTANGVLSIVLFVFGAWDILVR